MGLVQSLDCFRSLGFFLSSQLHQLLGKLTPILGNSAPAKCPTAEPVTALPLFNGQMVLYAYANGDVVGIDADRRVLLRESIPKEVFQPCGHAPRVSRFARATDVARFAAQHLEALPPRPAVLGRWATEHWAALQKWDFDFFERTCGNIKVEVTLPKGQREVQPLARYLQCLRRKKPGDQLPYLRGWYYERDAPWLADDIWQAGDFHEVFKDSFKRFPTRYHPDFHWLFIGGAGAVTPLHIDPTTTHAWLTQISGRKRFTLWAPSDIPELLSEDQNRIFRPLPEFRASAPVGCRAVDVILEPGETIFVPAHWPHEVECLDDSISVTWNFLGKTYFPLVRAAYLANSVATREAEG